MVAKYHQQPGIARMDVRHVFEAGDQLMLRNREYGKNKCRSLGPYWFVRYEGRLGTQAVVANVKGQHRVVSVTNILPIRAPASRMHRFMPGVLPTPV
jgi:hypothetical protein